MDVCECNAVRRGGDCVPAARACALLDGRMQPALWRSTHPTEAQLTHPSSCTYPRTPLHPPTHVSRAHAPAQFLIRTGLVCSPCPADENEGPLFFRDYTKVSSKERLKAWDRQFYELLALPNVLVTPHRWGVCLFPCVFPAGLWLLCGVCVYSLHSAVDWCQSGGAA